MAGCSTCSSASSCPGSSLSGGDGNCNDPYAEQDKLIAEALKKIKNKLFIMSGKGGVGKSSVTVNTAAALAQKGYKVGVLDADLHGPSVPNLLALNSVVEVDPQTGKMLPAKYNDNLAVISMDSFLQDRDQAILWRGPKKTAAIRQFLSDVQWGDLDYLLIDSPPGTGDEHMTVLKCIPDARSIVVTTPQEISLADVRKAINFLKYTDAPILGLVENMSGLLCPNCGEEIEIFKKGGGEKLAKNCKIRFLGAIPLDPAAVVAADLGVPVVYLERNGPAKEAFLTLAGNIIQACGDNLENLS